MATTTKQHPYYELIKTQDEGIAILKESHDPLLIVNYLLTVYSPDKMTSFGYLNQVIGPLIDEREGYLFRIWFNEKGLRIELIEKALSSHVSFKPLKDQALDDSPKYYDSDCRRKHYQGRADEIHTEIGKQIEPNRLLWQSHVKPHWSDSCCLWAELVDPSLYDAGLEKYRANLYTYLARKFYEQSKNFYPSNKKRCSKEEIDKWQSIIQNLLSLTNLGAELDQIDKKGVIPVLVTAERIMKFLVVKGYKPSKPKSIYENPVMPIPKEMSRLGRPLIALYRHSAYKMCNWDTYRYSLTEHFKNLIT